MLYCIYRCSSWGTEMDKKRSLVSLSLSVCLVLSLPLSHSHLQHTCLHSTDCSFYTSTPLLYNTIHRKLHVMSASTCPLSVRAACTSNLWLRPQSWLAVLNKSCDAQARDISKLNREWRGLSWTAVGLSCLWNRGESESGVDTHTVPFWHCGLNSTVLVLCAFS